MEYLVNVHIKKLRRFEYVLEFLLFISDPSDESMPYFAKTL